MYGFLKAQVECVGYQRVTYRHLIGPWDRPDEIFQVFKIEVVPRIQAKSATACLFGSGKIRGNGRFTTRLIIAGICLGIQFYTVGTRFGRFCNHRRVRIYEYRNTNPGGLEPRRDLFQEVEILHRIPPRIGCYGVMCIGNERHLGRRHLQYQIGKRIYRIALYVEFRDDRFFKFTYVGVTYVAAIRTRMYRYSLCAEALDIQCSLHHIGKIAAARIADYCYLINIHAEFCHGFGRFLLSLQSIRIRRQSYIFYMSYSSLSGMKIFIYARPRDHMPADSIRKLKQIADESGLSFSINEEYADMIRNVAGLDVERYCSLYEKDLEGDSIMMSIGGDGTFLETVQLLKGLPVPIVGMNTGRLGFLTAMSPHNFQEGLERIKKSDYSIEKRIMLSVEGDFGTEVDFPCALNEFTIHRHNASMVEVTVRADGELIGVARGDGVIAATPTGSTAYSLSAGGPVLSPECECFVLTPLAPHNFTIRPLVVPDTSEVSMEISSRGRDVAVSIDNKSYVVPDGSRFVVRKSRFSTFLMHLQNISFYDTLRNKMMWGVDKREPGV